MPNNQSYRIRTIMQATVLHTQPRFEAYTQSLSNFGYPDGVSAVDLVPEHLKHLIHPHWNNYPPVNPMWHYLLGMIYILLGFLAICG